jgi:hypothetical protein
MGLINIINILWDISWDIWLQWVKGAIADYECRFFNIRGDFFWVLQAMFSKQPPFFIMGMGIIYEVLTCFNQ